MTVLDTRSGTPSPTRSGGGPAGSFPGFGEGAPLDLSSLSDTDSAGLLSRLLDGTADALSDALAGVGNCVRPIRLHGSSQTIDRATGEVVASYSSADAPLGVLMVPCGNRRGHACPSCARTYARDTFELIRAGVIGGKTVPATVAAAPLLFVTLTAPSFGLVHGVRANGGRCRPRSADRVERCPHGIRLSCNAAHSEDDPLVGSPLCWDCYDWTSAVVWQWWAPELWRRTTIAVRRAIADRLGVPRSRLGRSASLQFVKVAEYQARGLIHFHAMIRLDGPDGPGSPAPMDGDTLATVLRDCIPSVRFTAPPVDEDDPGRRLAWGAQLDVKTITHGATLDGVDLRSVDELTPAQVAGYLAKYATKDATDLRVGTRNPAHLARMNTECRRLHALAVERDEGRRAGHPTRVPLDPKTQTDPYALLGKWAHTLGFRGHFATKSRRYSVTLGRLRKARERYRRLIAQSERDRTPLDLADLERRLLTDDDDETTLVVGDWRYAGTGWPRPGDAALATAAAARAREYDQWRAHTRKNSPAR